MNERILEFADMAKFMAEETINMKISANPLLYTFAEQFAQLIVKECANIVNSLEQHQGPGDCSIAEYIKEHLGVEE